MSVRLSIVIPVFNSEKTIGPLVDHLIEALQGMFTLEVVLVNDASKDRSENECNRLFEKHPEIVRFYGLAKNVGEHNAVMAGLNQCRGDAVVIMDDDLQNPISEVQKLVEVLLRDNFDVVYSIYARKHHTWFQNLISKLNDAVANVILHKPQGLYLSSFKALNRFVVDQVIEYKLPFPYIDGLILRVTENIGQVQVEHEERSVGHSGYTFVKWANLWMNMFTNFSIIPLRASILLGGLFSVAGLVLGTFTIIEKIMNPSLPRGYTSLMVAVAMFSGVQLIAIGLIGEYLGRIFISMNKHPQYTIRKRREAEPV